MQKQVTALILSLLMAGTLFSCGADAQPGTDTTSGNDTDAVTEPADNGPKSGVPDSVKFDGETVSILNSQYHEKYFALLDTFEATGDSVSDSVYNRNLAVMDKLGVTFTVTNMFDKEGDGYAKMRLDIESGSGEFDLYFGNQYRNVSLAVNDYCFDMKDAPYIDVSQPWWYADYMENINFNDRHRYILNGDFSLNFLHQIAAVYFNKSLMEDYFGDADFLYDEVLDGKWTLERMMELVANVWDDKNGNQKIDFSDTIGLAMQDTNYINYTLFFAAGGEVTVTESDGSVIINNNIERNVDISSTIFKLVRGTTGVYLNDGKDGFAKLSEAADNGFPQKFSEGTMLFTIGQINTTDQLRDMKDDYGVIPYPKFDASGEYRSIVQDHAASVSLPKNTTRSELCAAVIEEMTFQGYMTMVPDYYSIVLKNKYMRDTDDKAMQILDLIHDTAYTQVGFAYGAHLNGLWRISRETISKNNDNYATLWAAALSKATEKFKTIQEYFSK
ncbi:MAG: extracellular solute-binding protein [Ruminococcaceae bacterium]|nr:extracellular solute-binding protein [Oscillospiraceae bacterium]